MRMHCASSRPNVVLLALIIKVLRIEAYGIVVRQSGSVKLCAKVQRLEVASKQCQWVYDKATADI